MMHQFFFARVCALTIAALPATAPGTDGDAVPPGVPLPLHTVAVRLRGPVAHVEVVRSLTATPGGRPDAAEAVLDLALPAGAALLSVDVRAPGPRARWQATATVDAAHARRTYADALLGRGLGAARDPADEATTHRVRVVWTTGARPLSGVQPAPVLRYRYTALGAATGGGLHLRFSASPELTPLPATVTIEASGPGEVMLLGPRDRPTATATGANASLRLRATAPARDAWEIVYRRMPATPTKTAGPAPTPAALTGVAATAALGGGDRALAVAALAGRPPKGPPPDTVLFLIDRSRSVGLAGLAAERDVARRLLESLPPSTRFDGLFFDRQSQRLFPAARPATREAIGALDAELVPDRLANGTSLGHALHAAGELLRGEAAAFAPRVLLAIVTDGALPDDDTAAALDAGLGPLPGLDVTVAALLVRAPDDEPAPPTARAALRQLVAARGGVVRDVPANRLGDAVPAALTDAASGGDLFAVQVQSDEQRRPLIPTLRADDGTAIVLRWPAAARAPLTVNATRRGHPVTAPLRPVTVDPSWLQPLLAPASASAAALLTGAELTALIEPVAAAPVAPDPADEGRGSVDRAVVQNTLALAFMPRARACYQNRSGATPASRQLTGRVRLAIDLIRGEVAAARLESSTLASAPVEVCLRESAFALDVPRATRSDAPVTAIVNLVFRPRPPEKVHTAEDSFPIGGEIDLALEELRRFERAPPATTTPEPPDLR